jgi:signal transduction histidine kinase
MERLLNYPDDFEGVLVRVDALLVNLIEGAGRQTLILQSSNSIFTAHLEQPQMDERFRSLKIGSTLAVTGVFLAQSPGKWIPHHSPSRERSASGLAYSQPESVQILMRSFADIAVLQQPPWWTLSHLLWMIGILSLILLAGLTWAVVLRRRVLQQTLIIQQKVRREGIMEERDRIAREFHDTLEQELAAITIQLDAVEARFQEAPQTARRMLGLARNMSRRSLSEARRSVWDLRSHLLENSDLTTALTEMAAPLALSAGVEIKVKSSGTPQKLPAITEHNLLRITQEALVNALKHSHPRKITVGLNYEPNAIRLCIRDDGTGFEVQTAGSVSGGHFGMLDMRERAEKIGGRFSLISQPGSGTEIVILVSNTNTGELETDSPNGKAASNGHS